MALDYTLTLFDRAAHNRTRTAIVDEHGRHSYGELLDAARCVAAHLLGGRPDLEEARVAYLVAPGFPYVAVQWGIWMAGGVAVPLAVSHPGTELAYTVTDSGASHLLAGEGFEERVGPVAEKAGVPWSTVARAIAADQASELPELSSDRRAMILYTSGTTNRPKGVVSTHGTIQAQVETLVEAWGWREDDHILLILPLHHVHGIINVLTCALWSGATCTMHGGFEADRVWSEIADGTLTLFMAVPTVYSKLIQAWEDASDERQRAMSDGCRQLRLMVSGSAALPVSVLEKWRSISGHTLLERYGMTEIGMALSNPLDGERRPGHVGRPLPGVEVRLVDEQGREVGSGESGQIEVRGPSVFSEYWQRPEVTRESFRDGWFQTGDIAELNDGYYRILGRDSVDILKTGGYKVSALEIEEVLRRHPGVAECAVVGIPDEEWGEIVCAAVVAAEPNLDTDLLLEWARDHLAPYKLPRRIMVLEDLPRNAMGKVTKPAVKQLFGG